MKKVNKILMATVAILLSLVLISTSVLSGVFAKFVDTKSAGATVSLKAFGFTLSLSHTDRGGGEVKYTEVNDEKMIITVEGISVPPAANFTNFMRFTINGDTATVDKVKIVLKVDVSGVDSFAIPTIDEIPTEKKHIPFAFVTAISPDTTYRISSADNYWTYVTDDDDLQKKIINGIVADVKADASNKFNSVYKNGTYSIAARDNEANVLDMVIWDTSVEGNKRQVNYLAFGLRGYGYSGTATGVSGLVESEAHLLQTYLAEMNPAPSLTITYTVSLEQVVD